MSLTATATATVMATTRGAAMEDVSTACSTRRHERAHVLRRTLTCVYIQIDPFRELLQAGYSKHRRSALLLRRRRPRPPPGRAPVEDEPADDVTVGTGVRRHADRQRAELAGAHPHGDSLAGRHLGRRRRPRMHRRRARRRRRCPDHQRPGHHLPADQAGRLGRAAPHVWTISSAQHLNSCSL